MSKQETRFLASELRAETEGEQFILSGYAALFSSPSKDLGFIETIAPGAFDRALRERQLVRFTFQHSLDAVLARTDNSTLQLSTDSKGLKFRAQLNRKIQLHSDLWEATKAGLYNEMSFAFEVAEGGDTWSADGRQRTLRDVDLFDVSLVATGAYSNTLATARSADGATLDETFQRLTARAITSIEQADQERRRAAAAVLARIAAENRADDDNAEDEVDPFEAACRALGLDYCDNDESFVFASDPNDLNEQNCLRFEYQIADEGAVVLNEDSRTKVKHELLHSERGRKILFFKRMKRTAGRG